MQEPSSFSNIDFSTVTIISPYKRPFSAYAHLSLKNKMKKKREKQLAIMTRIDTFFSSSSLNLTLSTKPLDYRAALEPVFSCASLILIFCPDVPARASRWNVGAAPARSRSLLRGEVYSTGNCAAAVEDFIYIHLVQSSGTMRFYCRAMRREEGAEKKLG